MQPRRVEMDTLDSDNTSMYEQAIENRSKAQPNQVETFGQQISSGMHGNSLNTCPKHRKIRMYILTVTKQINV